VKLVPSVFAWVAGWQSRNRLRECDDAGEGAVVEGRPTVANQGRMRVGRRFHFASRPAPSHMVTGPKGCLEVGDDVAIGHGAAIAAYAGVTIGEGTRIGPYAIIMDTDFHVAGDRDGEPQSEPIVIGAGVQIGNHVTVLRGSEIGDGAVVAPGSVVAGKVRAGARVAGVPAREAAPSGGGHVGPAAESVPKVVKNSLGLSYTPSPEEGPLGIPQWDSLGALRLLLALEDAFGVTLSEDAVLKVTSVADLATIVEQALARASGDHESTADADKPVETAA
jgi:acetyltransferase-like isoleucine patch superfamily enzyme